MYYNIILHHTIIHYRMKLDVNVVISIFKMYDYNYFSTF